MNDIKRVILKLSGEALSGDKKSGYDDELIMDIAGPDVNINIGCYRWNTFDHNIKFRFFSKNTQTITITAFDNISANVKIEYYLAEKNMSKEELSSEKHIQDAFFCTV